MKFCKVLESQAKDMPGLNDMFLRYKQLKKKINAIPVPGDAPETVGAGPDQAAPSDEGGTGGGQLSPEEQEFMAALNEDLQRFNAFFIDKEEDAVIKLQDISDQMQQKNVSKEQLNLIKTRLVDFHGELVMTLHWSLINYSAIVKILKKHDKRTGFLLRAPYLANVLQQPFSSTNVMSRLVKRAEELVEKAVELTTEKPVGPVAVAAAAPATAAIDAPAEPEPANSSAPAATTQAAGGPPRAADVPKHGHSSDDDECSSLSGAATAAAAAAAAAAEQQQQPLPLMARCDRML